MTEAKTREEKLAGFRLVAYDGGMARAADDTVEQIKARLNIADVIAQYTKLTRAGSSFKARCPFHNEKTPSFMVSPDRGTYHCFGCGVHGDMFTFVQEIEGIDFKGALKMLGERAGVEVIFKQGEKKDDTDRIFMCVAEAMRFFEGQMTQDHPARAYLNERGLTNETIRDFHIGWAPDEWRALSDTLTKQGFSKQEMADAGLIKEGDKGVYDKFRSRIMFPLNDTAGRPVAFSGRIFAFPGKTHPDDTAKYMNSPETVLFKKSRMLYGFDRAKQSIRKHNFAILVEGQMDLVMVHQAGWGNAVAVSGTALTPEHVALVHRMSDNLLLALDADDAGIQAAQKSATIALAQGMDVKVARLVGGKDPADIIVHDGKDAWAKAIREARHIIEFLLTVLEGKSKDARDFARQTERVVLPFITQIQSPIDRDHFIQLVADRINVTPESIREGVRRVPQGDAPAFRTQEKTKQVQKRHVSLRVLEAWSILETEKQKAKPVLHVEKAMEQLTEALGGSMDVLSVIPEAEKEAARFSVEGRYDTSRALTEGFAVLIRTIKRERLQKAYEEATQSLHIAEKAGDEEGVRAALGLCTALSGELAKLA